MDIISYNNFAESCLQELQVLQAKFLEAYNIDSYEQWLYNQATGLLTFSTGSTELNFKYFEAGSYYPKSTSWKWAWDNHSTLDNVKRKSLEVKAYGEQCNFSKLIDGYFQSDEYEAWEFTAIARKLAKGIGVYRPVNEDGLQIFMVITAFVDNETAQEIKDKFVSCGTHEYRRRAFVCQHLATFNKVGFEEAFETQEDMELSDDDDLQAWCDECEVVRKMEGEWTDKAMAFANITVVCEKCYFEMKALNLK